MQGLVYTLPGVAAIIAAMLVGAALFAKLPTRQLTFFGLFNFGTFLWASGYFIGYTLSMLFPPALRSTVAAVLFLAAQLGVALTPTYWFLFTAETTGATKWTRGWRLALVHVPGILLLLAAATNDYHHLFASRTGITIAYAPLGVAVLIVLYVPAAAACVMYLRAARRDTVPSAGACYSLAVAGIAILVLNVAWTTRGLTGLSLPYNPTILLLPFIGILIALLVLRAGLLDVVPVAEGQAFHGMADGGIVLSAEGRIVAINDAAERMLPHLRRGRLLADDAPRLAADVEHLSAGHTDLPHGDQAWWLRVVPMRSPGGRPLGMLVLLTDLAEKRAFEQRIVELNRDLRHTVFELETATRAKDRFIANASHELRTPLQSVIGYTQRLLFERVGRLQKAQRDELEIVERSAHHLLAVIESLLDIAQLESGQLSVVRTDFDPAATVRQVLDTLEPLASVKGLEMIGVYNGPSYVYSDETKVRQVVLNLAANAVKFTESGSVTIECMSAGDAGGVFFQVRDTGPGIPAAELDLIFEAFHRVLTGSTDKAGAGLGLYVSQVLTGILGGRIDVESVTGIGTSFTVWFPDAPPASETDGVARHEGEGE